MCLLWSVFDLSLLIEFEKKCDTIKYLPLLSALANEKLDCTNAQIHRWANPRINTT